MIQTVCGKIEASELGVTLAHEHLMVDLSGVRGDMDTKFNEESDIDLIVTEILEAKKLGAQSVIEVSTNDMGRNVMGLKKISERTGLHIVAATGFYLDSYHPSSIRELSAEKIAEIFLHDLKDGIGDTGIKAGVIGEVASGTEMTASERNVLNAAAIAGRAFGCAVTTHCQLGTLAEEQIAIFQNHDMNLHKVILGHMDLADSMDYYREVLATGVNIGFDTVGKTAYLSDEARADNLSRLIDEGYASQIVLSEDISRKSYMKCSGKAGYAAVLGRFIPMLKERHVSEEMIHKMLVENPARIFDIE